VKDLNNTNEVTVEVFSGTLWEAEMVRSLLDNAQISNFMKNNLLNHFMYDPIKAEGAKVIVLERDRDEASNIVAHYINNQK